MLQYSDACAVDDAVTKLVKEKTAAVINAALANQPGMASDNLQCTITDFFSFCSNQAAVYCSTLGQNVLVFI